MEDIKHILAKVSVNIIAIKDDQVLMVQQARPEHVAGKWSLPGGKVDIGESFDETVIRETKEEVGLEASNIKHIGIIHDHPDSTVKHIFTAKINDGEFTHNPEEILEVKWQYIRNVMNDKIDLRGDWVKKALAMIERQ